MLTLSIPSSPVLSHNFNFMRKRVVITGLGVLAGNGKGRQDFWNALREGRIGYKPITLFDTSSFRTNQAGEISDFDPTLYMGAKGLRSLDRSTKLVVSAAKQAIDDSQFQITEENTDDVGVAIGTTLGSVKSMSDFDEVTLKEGPRYTNPALFPNTVINSPASQISIWHKIKGFNTTVSTGFTASLDAMQYGYDFIQLNRAKVIYTGGVEEMCYQTFYGFYMLKFLSGAKEGSVFVNCPFDKRRNGITFGEGACVMALEEHDHAKARNARILGEVVAFGTKFDPYRINKYNPRGDGLKEALRMVLDEAEMSSNDIDYISANANSTIADRIETDAIKEVFGARSYKIPVSAIKSMIGESYSVSGAFAVAGALGSLNENFVPPTMNYQEKDTECDLDVVPNQAREANVKNALVVNFSPSGNNTCVILRRYE